MKGSISTLDLLRAKLKYQQDLAEYDQAKSAHYIVSPITGIVTDTPFAVGDYVHAGDRLANVIDLNSLEIAYTLPARYAGSIHVGQKISFTTLSDNKAYIARITYIAPAISSDATELNIRADFTENIGLWLNSFGKIEQYIDEHKMALAIPQQLVQSDSQGFYVYLLEDNKVSKRYFNAGAVTPDGFIEVESGINVSDRLINSDPRSLQPNQTVKVKQ